MNETSSTMRTGAFFLKVVAVAVGFALVLSQLYVIYRVKQNFYTQGTDIVQRDQEQGEVQSISELIDNLPKPQIDVDDFESEVIEPQQELIEKFPRHPDMVLQKLTAIVEKERQRSSSLLQEINQVRENFNLPRESEHIPSPISRKLNSVNESREKYFKSLAKCPQNSPHLLGPLIIRQNDVPDLKEGTSEYHDWYGNIKTGGTFKPSDCIARQKVAIIIPYRDREWHLKVFLYYMHPFLQRQQLDYQIFVIEQAGNTDFNRGALMNIGYNEASKVGAFTCFILHDVDLVPEDDRHLYTCTENTAKHMAVSVNKWKYRLPYDGYFGGVTALSKEQMVKSNGFSNNFYGWGGEDDDLHRRVIDKSKFPMFRYPGNVARFSMLKHGKAGANEDLSYMMERSKNNLLENDGLTSLKYKVLNSRSYPLYTWILVKLPDPPPKQPKSAWSQVSNLVWNGMNQLAGGFAAKVAQDVGNFAKEQEESYLSKRSQVYR